MKFESIISMLVCFLFILSICSSLAFAQDYEEQNLSISVSSIGKLIDVSTILNMSNLIPYKEYSSKIVVEWAIPDEALSGLKGTNDVVIFVALQTSNESSFISFKEGDEFVTGVTTLLRCKITNGTCGEGSELRKEIEYSITINKLGETFNDAIKVRASLMPTEEFTKRISESIELNNSLEDLSDAVKGLNISDADRYIFNADLQKIQASLDDLDTETAKTKLIELNSTLETLTKKSNLFTKITEIEQELKVKTNLTKEEADLATEISQVLVDARKAVDELDFNKAELYISLARNKLNILNQMIIERSNLLSFCNKDMTYCLALGLAIIIFVMALIMNLGKGEKIVILVFSALIIVLGILRLEHLFGSGVYTIFLIVEAIFIAILISVLLRKKKK